MEYAKSFDFNYKRGKFSSELHHSFFLDLPLPIDFPLFTFFNILQEQEKLKKNFKKL